MKIFKLKKDKVEKFKEWTHLLNTTLRDEAMLSLKEENCSRELIQFFEIQGEFYIATHIEGEDIVPSNKEREINKRHIEIMKECIEEKIATETLYDIKSII